MTGPVIFLVIVLAPLLFIFLWAIGAYNRLVALRNRFIL